ncbi:MAG: hypothetical protein M3Y85_09810 [Bacteroidota bacterium]|nr:hypothetical protein [Bacteroidota bacterium]
MILRFLFFVFLFYLLFKLVFDFIIPIYKTTRQVKRKFREMHQHMHPGADRNAPGNNQPTKEKTAPGDYIDYEEVKD